MNARSAAQTMTWIALAFGMVVLVLGAASLARREVLVPWMREHVVWKPFAWSQVLFGVFIATETVPRLAGASSGLALTMSTLAFAPMLAGVALQLKAKRS